MSAAKYLGISPWDLEQQSVIWRERALWAQDAEYEAQKRHSK